MSKLITCAVALLAVQACALESSNETFLLEDGATYRLGRQTAIVEADRVVFTDGKVELPLAPLLGDLDLSALAFLDVAVRRVGDEWELTVLPGHDLRRQSRGGAYCENWRVTVRYEGGTVTSQTYCTKWVNL